MSRVRGVDAARVGQMFLLHGPKVRAYLLTGTRDPDAADDLVSETFTAALLLVHKFSGTDTDAMRWLVTIARFRFRHWLARRARSREELRADPVDEQAERVPGADEAALDALSAAELRAAINRLPSHIHQQWVALRYLRGLDNAGAAVALGRNPMFVSRLNSRALDALRSDSLLRKAILGEVAEAPSGPPRPWGLRQHHQRVAELTQQNMRCKDIAELLGLTPGQVAGIRKTIRAKSAKVAA